MIHPELPPRRVTMQVAGRCTSRSEELILCHGQRCLGVRDVESEDRPDSGIKVDVEPLCAGISIHDRLHTLEGVSW